MSESEIIQKVKSRMHVHDRRSLEILLRIFIIIRNWSLACFILWWRRFLFRVFIFVVPVFLKVIRVLSHSWLIPVDLGNKEFKREFYVKYDDKKFSLALTSLSSSSSPSHLSDLLTENSCGSKSSSSVTFETDLKRISKWLNMIIVLHVKLTHPNPPFWFLTSRAWVYGYYIIIAQFTFHAEEDRPPKNWRSGLTGLCQTDDILALISRLDSCMQ